MRNNKDNTYRTTTSVGSSVLPSLGHVRYSLLVGKILPDLGDLFYPVLPLGVLHLQVGVVDVGVEDHRDGGILSLRFVRLPLLHVLLGGLLGGGSVGVCLDE